LDVLTFVCFLFTCWITISLLLGFYQISRLSVFTDVLKKLFKQALLLSVVVACFFGYYYERAEDLYSILAFVFWTMLVVGIMKSLFFFSFKHYRQVLGGNLRKVMVIGSSNQADLLVKFLRSSKSHGYQLSGTLTFTSDRGLQEVKEKVLEEYIDELYCCTESLTERELHEITDFADNNLRTVKIILSHEQEQSLYGDFDLYGHVPIYSLRQIPLHDPANRWLKRSFDILFSSLVIVLILSWLAPILAILIRLESKGPVFFKQKRNGLDYQEFNCYKFRSMYLNPMADLHQVTRGDSRITGIGKFLRKTSLDELPQFVNVLLGHMSVVGPRPHMVSHTEMYAASVNKFMVRHFVKPGITGLAQTSGYRGEVESEEDIYGRVHNDLMYIENWSLSMDVRIIVQTILNVFKGEEKAY
jgi:putative colanic acid biosynthesis UDP-glucose lipid carrier transferase